MMVAWRFVNATPWSKNVWKSKTSVLWLRTRCPSHLCSRNLNNLSLFPSCLHWQGGCSAVSQGFLWIAQNFSTLMSALRAGYTGSWGLMTQTFRACFVLLLVGCGWAVTACSSDEPSDPVYENWAARNSAAFSDTLSMARKAIAQAKAQYGDAWTEHPTLMLITSIPCAFISLLFCDIANVSEGANRFKRSDSCAISNLIFLYK